MQETQEELEAVFGEEMRAAGTLRGDDKRLDVSIEKGSSKRSKSQERVREWEDGAEFARNQDIVEGEVGERDVGGVVMQDGEVPEVETHAGGKVDAAARKAAKKQRRLAELKQKQDEKAKEG